ncbi:MAG: hypothetical protein LBR06_07795 [Bacteroidales bacterium]|nr:hypothetical protein [Bacteroidales bacterium]
MRTDAAIPFFFHPQMNCRCKDTHSSRYGNKNSTTFFSSLNVKYITYLKSGAYMLCDKNEKNNIAGKKKSITFAADLISLTLGEMGEWLKPTVC